jgi:hypothetical protein
MRMTRQEYDILCQRMKQDANVLSKKVLSVHSMATRVVVKKTTDEEKLNKTEYRYLQHLRSLDHQWIGIQNITLKLADDTRFTPDFSVVDQSGCIVFTDVKGFQREDALIKAKVAARQFPFVSFEIVKLINGQWEITRVKP